MLNTESLSDCLEAIPVLSVNAMGKPQRNWFKDRLADRGISQRKLALSMGLDPASLHRRLAGIIPVTADEAGDISRLLGVPIADVLQQLGARPGVTDDRERVPVGGTAGADGMIADGAAGGPRSVERPKGGAAGLAAVRIAAPAQPWDGWACIYQPSTRLEPDAIGRLAVLELDDGRRMLGIARKGFERGKWRVAPLGSSDHRGEIGLESATPVLWIRL